MGAKRYYGVRAVKVEGKQDLPQKFLGKGLGWQKEGRTPQAW